MSGRVTRSATKAAREAEAARQAASNAASNAPNTTASNDPSTTTSKAAGPSGGNQQPKSAPKGTSSKRKRSSPAAKKPSKAAKTNKSGGPGASSRRKKWPLNTAKHSQEGSEAESDVSDNSDKGSTTKGKGKEKERQRSTSAETGSSKNASGGSSSGKGGPTRKKKGPQKNVEESSPDDSDSDTDGSDDTEGGNKNGAGLNLLDNPEVMKWVDDNHVINEGAEMESVAPQVKDLMGTWRWIWRTGHGHIPLALDYGGIAFRMSGTEPFSNPAGIRGRMRYDPQLVSTDLCKWDFRFARYIPGAMEITINMSGDEEKKDHPNAMRIPARLRFTTQPGRTNRYGERYAHRRLLCVKYLDADEGEVELFALAQNGRNEEDGPRGFPSTTAGKPNETTEEESPNFGHEVEDEGLLWEFGVDCAQTMRTWARWVGWKGQQKGWYQRAKAWTFW